MKKTLLIMSLLVTAALTRAQSIDSLPHLFVGMGYPILQPESFIETHDGNLLCSSILAYDFESPAVGHHYHKVSRHGCSVMESFMVQNEMALLPFQYIAKDPLRNGYVLIKLINDTTSGLANLQITRFDDQLDLSHSDTTVFLANHLVNGFDNIAFNQHGDLIVGFYDWDTNANCFAQYGLDGSLKNSKRYDNGEIEISHNSIHYGLIPVGESKERFAFWGVQNIYLENYGVEFIMHIYVLDSKLSIVESFAIPEAGLAGYLPRLTFGSGPSLSDSENGDWYFACGYGRLNTSGAIVFRFSPDFELVDHKELPSQHADFPCFPVNLKKSRDGNLYLSYIQPYWIEKGGVTVVKMDEDLNVIWKRHCLDDEGYGRGWCKMIVLEDNSVAVVGNNVLHGELFFLVVNDDYDALEEQGVIVRPYAYWPNPAKDELHLQYSPDVKPAQAELFDLQGRLVLRQRNGLETLNLQGLAPGTYTLRVTLEDGKTFSDKVVKE